MRAVRRSESVVDIDLDAGRELLREVRIVLLFLRMEAEIFEQDDFMPSRPSARPGPMQSGAMITRTPGSSSASRDATGARLISGYPFTLGTAEVAGQDQRRAVIESVLDGGERRLDAFVAGDFKSAGSERNIEVHSNKDHFSLRSRSRMESFGIKDYDIRMPRPLGPEVPGRSIAVFPQQFGVGAAHVVGVHRRGVHRPPGQVLGVRDSRDRTGQRPRHLSDSRAAETAPFKRRAERREIRADELDVAFGQAIEPRRELRSPVPAGRVRGPRRTARHRSLPRRASSTVARSGPRAERSQRLQVRHRHHGLAGRLRQSLCRRQVRSGRR